MFHLFNAIFESRARPYDTHGYQRQGLRKGNAMQLPYQADAAFHLQKTRDGRAVIRDLIRDPVANNQLHNNGFRELQRRWELVITH